MAQALRTWKNADGTRTVEGEFAGLDGDRITLRLKDGTSSTFSLQKLSPEDRRFAEEESRKPKTELRDLIGRSGQAFDTLRFGMTRDQYDSALAKSSHALSVGGTEVEFFGQKVTLGEFLVRIDGRSFLPVPLFVDDILTELRLEGTPVEAAPDSAIRSRVGGLKAAVVLAFGDPAESFKFPEMKDLPPEAFGVTDTWLLPGGRQLYLAVARDEKNGGLSCALRLTRGK